MINLDANVRYLFRSSVLPLHPEAIIAGGAVRDAYFGFQPKDYDVFIQYPTDPRTKEPLTLISSKEQTLEFGSGLFFAQMFDLDESNDFVGEPLVPAYDSDAEDPDSHILAMWDVIKGDVIYQVIAVDIPPIEYCTQHFDFGLCITYYDGMKMRYTHEFLQDATNQTLSLQPHLSEKRYFYALEEHLPRLQAKFSDFRVVIPQEMIDRWGNPLV